MQYSQPESGTVEIDLHRIFKAVLKSLWIIGVVTIVCGMISLLYSIRFVTPMYRASTSFYVVNKIPLGGSNTNISSNDHVTSVELVNSYIAILNTRDTLMDVIEHSGLNIGYNQLYSMISPVAIENTEVFRVSVSSADPNEAFTIANSIAHVVTTQICNVIEGSSVKVVEKAVRPSSPYSPNFSRYAVMGLLFGLVISTGIVILIEVFNTKIKSEDDLKSFSSYPVLVAIPDMTKSSKHGYYRNHSHHYGYFSSDNNDSDPDIKKANFIGKGIDFLTTEAYKLLRTKIQYSLADDQKCRAFLVSSAFAGEGKSITSINLAYSLAQLNKKVLLIDCDMRRPTIANKLNLPNYPGLAEYLTGFMSLDELIQTFSDNGEHQPISVITAGNTPPNPVELINSAKMEHGMEVLRQQYDYIVIDVPPIDDVSDALVATKLVDGVLLIVRHNYCTRAAVRNAVHQFEFVDTKILGFVLNSIGNKTNNYSKSKYHDRYGYHYAYQPRSKVEKQSSDNNVSVK